MRVSTLALCTALSLLLSDGFILQSRPTVTPVSLALQSSYDSHDYERDSSRDNSSVDVEAVNALLGERLRARKRGDFDTADRIRDQLNREHKVSVFDKDKIWATESDRYDNRGGSRHFAQGGRGGRGRGDRGRVGGRGRGPRPHRDFRGSFGPNGHDYHPCNQAGPNSSAMSEPEIHTKIADRLMAKMNRDFDTADKVQLELAEKGVYINDRAKEWRADGVQFIDPSEGRRTPSDRNRPFVQSKHSQPLQGTSHQEIQQMLAERDQYKWSQKYAQADRIRDALAAEFDILLDDRIREWSVGGSFGKEADTKRAHNLAMKSRDYVKSSASLELPEGIAQEEIQARVDERTKAKRNKEYQISDAMRVQLLEEFGVTINDTIKMWSVGGDFGMDDPAKARAKALATFTRRGGGNLSEEDLVTIEGMLTKRVEAKRARKYEEADGIRTLLYETYNINIDDTTREWRVLGDDYFQNEPEAGAPGLTVEEVNRVESRIEKRTLLKKEKSYQLADEIRDELHDNYSVVLDDKKKEWKVIASAGGRRGNSGRGEQRDKQLFDSNDWEVLAAAGRRRRGNSDKRERSEPVKDSNDEPRFDSNDSPNPVPTMATLADVIEEESVPLQPALSEDELKTLTVPMLKEKLREAGKPVSGKKAELIERLLS